MVNFSEIRKVKIFIPILAALVITVLALMSCNKEVSVSPPDSPPPNGYLFIDSYPKGFKIYLNGNERRRATPDSLTWLATGQYEVTLKRELYRDTSVMANVVEGKKDSIYIDYYQNPAMLGSILCESNPPNAQIFLNGKDIGRRTPATVYNQFPGYYWVRFHAEGRRDDSVFVTVRSDSTSAVSLTLLDTAVWRDYTVRNSLIPTNNLTCINIDKNNTLWMGSYGYGVISFDGNIWNDYTSNNSQLTDNDINCIAFDNTGVMWLGTPKGPAIYFTMIGGSSDLPDFDIRAIGFDQIDNTWIGTQNGGLVKTYIDRHEGVRYWVPYNKSTGEIPDNWITSIASATQNVIWVGTAHGGIITNNGFGWKSYNRLNSSLPTNNVAAITVAEDGTVWIGCSGGGLQAGSVSYFDGSAFHTIYFSPSCSTIFAIFADSKGRIWVGTNTGIYIIENNSQKAYLDKETIGLHLDEATGFAEDKYGNIWISLNGGGLIEYKNSGSGAF